MKKAMVSMMVMAMVGMALYGMHSRGHYKSEVTVVEINGETYTFEDEDGELWELDVETESYELGEKVTLTMNNMDTPWYIYDDMIEDVTR